MNRTTLRLFLGSTLVAALVALVWLVSIPGANAAKGCSPDAFRGPNAPDWAKPRRATVLVDSVLLGSMPGIRASLRCWKVDMYGRPALMIRIAEAELREQHRRVAPLVIVGLGYNSLWERDRHRYGYWASRFRSEAGRLITTLRHLGAREIVWVKLREPKPEYLTSAGIGELGTYSWYFPYVNEQLTRLDAKRTDVVLADWTRASRRKGLTYDSIHVTPTGARLMGRVVKQAITGEARRQTVARRARHRRATRPSTIHATIARSTDAVTCVHVFGLPCAADNLAVRPQALVLGGDGRTRLTHIRWRGWGRSKATGRGVWRSDDARPDGPRHDLVRRRTRVVLRGLRHCGDQTSYASMTVYVPGERAVPEQLLYVACGD